MSSILIALLFFVARLSYSGYCFKEKRYLSDEEKINLAVQHVVRFYPPNIPYEIVVENGEQKKIRTGRSPKNSLPYRDLKEFLELNPNCCRVVMRANFSDGERYIVEFWDRLFGRTSCLVEVKYFVRYRDDAGVAHSYPAETFPAISNCGYLWNGI